MAETRRRPTGLYIGAGVVVLALIAWLVVVQVARHALITELGNRNLKARVVAARALLESGKLDDVLPGLPVYKRSYTAQALGGIQTPESTRVLGLILKDQEEAPQRWAGEALVKHGKRALPVLMAAMSATGGTKESAIKALVTLGRDAGPRLRYLLDDRGTYVNAAESLAKIGGVGTEALLVAAYGMDDKSRQQALGKLAAAHRRQVLKAALDNLDAKKDKLAQVDDAIKALGILGDPAAAPALVPFLATDKRAATATSLGLLRSPAATEPLLAQVQKGDGPYRDAATLALSRIGAPAFPALVRELKNPSTAMRRVAAGALVGSNSPQVTGALIAATADADDRVREPAALALGWSGNLAGVDALVKALRDRDWRVVDAAAKALGEIGPSSIGRLLTVAGAPGQDVTVAFQVSRAMSKMGARAVPQLISALSIPSPEVQKWSATALGAIGDQRAVPALKKLDQSATGDVKWVASEQLRVLAGTSVF
jgi:HEAT repeat protein